MSTFIAVVSLLTIILAVPLVALRPRWVFYLLLISVAFSDTLAGYIREANNLGLARVWRPSDGLACLTLIAAMLLPSNTAPGSNKIRKCLLIIAALAALSFVQGMFMYTHTALTFLRGLYFVPVFLFALRSFTTTEELYKFLKFICWLAIASLALHLAMRLHLWIPPITKEAEDLLRMGGGRGVSSLQTILYAITIAIALGRLATQQGKLSHSVIFLLVGITGVMLSETRGLYGVAGIMGLCSLFFIRGRVKTVLVYGTVILVGIWVVGKIGLDVTSRFRTEKGYGELRSVNPFVTEEQGVTWRGYEYISIVKTAVREPMFVLTGRGLGAMHFIPMERRQEHTGFVGYYHSELISWLDRYGLIGFGVLCTMFVICLKESYRLAKSGLDALSYLGTVTFLVMISFIPLSLFSPSFTASGSGPFLICFVVIVANWKSIYLNMYEDETLALEELPAEVSYS